MPLNNIVDNAIKYGGDTITIELNQLVMTLKFVL